MPGGARCDLAREEGRARVGLEPGVCHLQVALVRDCLVWAMPAHVLNVTIDALGELPVGGNFRFLLIRQVSEGTALTYTVTALDLSQLVRVHGHVIVIP